MDNLIDPVDASFILSSIGIEIGADFHQLESTKVERIIQAADNRKYKQPKNANGSRARYFHDYLQRRAAKRYHK